MRITRRTIYLSTVLGLAGWLGGDAWAGPSWEPDRRLTFAPGDSDLSFNFKHSVAVLPDGSVHAVWHDERDGIRRVYYKNSPDGGTAWGPDRPLSSSEAAGEHPAIAAAAGQVYVAWHEPSHNGTNIQLARSLDGGSTFEPPIQLSTSGTAAHASLAAFGHRVHIVWGDGRNGNAEIYARSSDDGGTHWGPEIRISEEPYESWVPSVAAWNEFVWVAWVDYGDANEEEYVRRSRDGGRTWDPPVRLTAHPADSWAPSIAAAGSLVVLAWFDRRDAGLMETDLEAVLDQTLALMGLAVEPAPARGPATYYLPEYQARAARKLTAIRKAAARWVAQGNNPKILEARLQEYERRNMIWQRGWSIYLTRSHDGGDTWEPARRISTPAGPTLRPSIALAGTGLHVVWYDGRHGPNEIYYRHSPDAGGYFTPEVRLTDSRGNSLRPSVAAGGARVHVVWSDDRDGNKEIYTKRRSFVTTNNDE